MSTVIATLPPCPQWCESHWGDTDEANTWHLQSFGSVDTDVPGAEVPFTVEVRLEQFEHIEDRLLMRETPTIEVRAWRNAWTLTVDEARKISSLLTLSSSRLDDFRVGAVIGTLTVSDGSTSGGRREVEVKVSATDVHPDLDRWVDVPPHVVLVLPTDAPAGPWHVRLSREQSGQLTAALEEAAIALEAVTASGAIGGLLANTRSAPAEPPA